MMLPKTTHSCTDGFVSPEKRHLGPNNKFSIIPNTFMNTNYIEIPMCENTSPYIKDYLHREELATLKHKRPFRMVAFFLENEGKPSVSALSDTHNHRRVVALITQS